MLSILTATEEEFGAHLRQYVSPARPIDTIEHLHGRAAQLVQIKRALMADGRHVFIWGDRGVGKSSLALTAAAQLQSSDRPHVFVSCYKDSTLASVVAEIARSILPKSSKQIESTFTANLGLPDGLPAAGSLEYQRKVTSSDKAPAPTQTLADCVEAMARFAKLHSESPVILVDEFDAIASVEERHRFADLLKHLGDRNIGVKFIFSGIASSLDELLAGHQSSFRQIESIPLDRLSWDARWDIVRDATKPLGVFVPHDIEVRIAAVSDGFPYFVHLITEKLLWRAFDARTTEVDWQLFAAALDDAVSAVEGHLKGPYERATERNSDDFTAIVWAAADAYDLKRHSSNIYKSYLSIVADTQQPALDQRQFGLKLGKLKSPAYGQILSNVPGRLGWYQFRLSMVRGFVRLVAEASGVQLDPVSMDEPHRVTARAPRLSARKVYRQNYVPRIKFRREPMLPSKKSDSDWDDED